MTWTTARDLKIRLMQRWDRGDLLRDIAKGHSSFPLRMTLKGPGSQDITDRFDAVRAWTAALSDTHPIRLEWQEIRHRVQGAQRLPSAAWIDTLDDALLWLGKRRDMQQFSELLATTRHQQPALVAWLEKRPLQALALHAVWPQLLAVVDWVVRHPRPGIYLRQVDLPGIHSKFIENHRAVLAEMLDLCLPAEQIDTHRTGVTQFATRYGFREKPTRIRFRVLDPQQQILPGTTCPDISLDADNFSRLTLAMDQVIITENETNFLALPSLPRTLAIFGAGYGWDALARARWLNQCQLFYWGDIDTHGFAILDQLRGHFSDVRSLLMDRPTLDAHKTFWGHEDKPQHADLHRLTPEESSLYNDLRNNLIREGLRLEQEHVGFDWVQNALMEMVAGSITPHSP